MCVSLLGCHLKTVLSILVAHQAVLGAEDLAALRVGAHVRLHRTVHLLVLHEIVLADEALPTAYPLAVEAAPRVDVLVGLEVWLLAESLAAAGEVTEVRLFGDIAALAVLVVVLVVGRLLRLLRLS